MCACMSVHLAFVLLAPYSALISRWANATLGARCTVENVPYIAYGASGEFIDIVSRYVPPSPCFASSLETL